MRKRFIIALFIGGCFFSFWYITTPPGEILSESQVCMIRAGSCNPKTMLKEPLQCQLGQGETNSSCKPDTTNCEGQNDAFCGTDGWEVLTQPRICVAWCTGQTEYDCHVSSSPILCKWYEDCYCHDIPFFTDKCQKTVSNPAYYYPALDGCG